MKRTSLFIVLLAAAFLLPACGNSGSSNEPEEETEQSPYFGLWAAFHHYDEEAIFADVIELKADNVCVYSEVEKDEVLHSLTIRWTLFEDYMEGYDAIVLSGGGGSEAYLVIKVSDTELLLADPDRPDDVETYLKCSSLKDVQQRL